VEADAGHTARHGSRMQGSQPRASFLVYERQLVSVTLQDECSDSSRHKCAALIFAILLKRVGAVAEVPLKVRAGVRLTFHFYLYCSSYYYFKFHHYCHYCDCRYCYLLCEFEHTMRVLFTSLSCTMR